MWLLIGFCLIQVITRATFASAQGNNECRFESITLRIFFHLLHSIQQLVADTEHQLAHQQIPTALTLTPTLLQRFHAPDFLPRSLQCRIVNLFQICLFYLLPIFSQFAGNSLTTLLASEFAFLTSTSVLRSLYVNPHELISSNIILVTCQTIILPVSTRLQAAGQILKP